LAILVSRVETDFLCNLQAWPEERFTVISETVTSALHPQNASGSQIDRSLQATLTY
jgi:hypothetical protein